MSASSNISREKAQAMVLNAQGLDVVKEDTTDIVKRLSYVQIDTISVTARSHHHVIYSRNPDYQQTGLEAALQRGEIFEYWSHAAAFLPMEDFRYSRFLKDKILKGEKFWFEKDPKVMRQVMRRIKKEGPLQSKDFVHKGKQGGAWFEWKPAKIALQQLFMEGRLMICSRQGFQKVYDLTERVLPDWVDTSKPTDKAFYTYLINRAISAQGIATPQEIGYLRKGSRAPIEKVLKEKLRKKELVQVTVDGADEVYYAKPESLESAVSTPRENLLYILNPFDNLVIQRKRLQDLFQFDYLIECYVPAGKRKHGYYTLPVLYQGRFVGRLDAKAERMENRLDVKQLWLEKGFQPDAYFVEALAAKLQDFVRFCGCEYPEVHWTESAKLKAALNTILSS